MRTQAAAPSLRACDVFSMAFLSPMSNHRPVSASFSRNRPGGLRARTASTMLREMAILSRLLELTYSSCLDM